MPVIKKSLPGKVKVSFQYGCAMELVCSLHVITDPSHHVNCIDWYDHVISHVEKKLIRQIVDFGSRYANWDLVMDLIDNFTKPCAERSGYFDDFFSVIERLDNLPREQFAYIFLGETLLGNDDNIYDLLLHPEHLDQYDLYDLYQYVSRDNAEYFIRHVDEVRKEMIDIITLYYNVYFQEHWKKTCAFYRGAAIKEKAQFAAADPANFIASLHDDLIYESNTLIMRKQIDFKVQSEEIKEIKIILSAFTYPHLMINIYGNRISLYRNMLMPDMSTTFDNMAKSIRVFSDPTRLSIVKLLLDRELTNKALASLLNITPASISQHLKILKEANMLYSIRRKNNILYRIKKKEVAQMLTELKRFLDI